MGIHAILILSLIIINLILIPQISSSDPFTLIYKGCASQSFSNGASAAASQQTLQALATAPVAQSVSSKFYKTTSSPSMGQPIFGLFQCRGDLTNNECAACVQHILPMWSSLCGISVAARIQLTGCYAVYQVSRFPQVSGTQMLFKTCGSGNAGDGFEEKRDTAFGREPSEWNGIR